MSELMYVNWYATVLRQDMFAAEVARIAPLALRYGATQYAVHVNQDDRYKITQMTWVEDHTDWYRYWEGPEMIEFRASLMGKYQIPIVYAWAEEIASGAMGPQVPTPEPQPDAPQPEPQAAVYQPRGGCGAVWRQHAEGELEPEPPVGAVQRVTEQLPQPPQPVAGGLRMDRHALGHLPQAALLGQPHPERGQQPLARAGGEIVQRREPVGGDLGGQSRIAAQQQLTGPLAGAHDPGPRPPALLLERQRRPGAGEADPRLTPVHGGPEPGPGAGVAHRAVHGGRPARAVRILDHRAGHVADRLVQRAREAAATRPPRADARRSPARPGSAAAPSRPRRRRARPRPGSGAGSRTSSRTSRRRRNSASLAAADCSSAYPAADSLESTSM